MFRMGPVHAWTTVQDYPVLNRNVPLSTGSYYIPIRLSIRPNRNRVSPLPKGIYTGDYDTPDRSQGSRGAITPHGNTWWPPGQIPGISCTTFVWPP